MIYAIFFNLFLCTWSVRAQSHDQRLSVTDHCLINTWSVHDEPCDQCLISQVISACAVTWSGLDQPRDQCLQREILKYNGDRYLLVYQLFLSYIFIFRLKVNFFHLYSLTSESPRWKDIYIYIYIYIYFFYYYTRRWQGGEKSLWSRVANFEAFPNTRNSFFVTTHR